MLVMANLVSYIYGFKIIEIIIAHLWQYQTESGNGMTMTQQIEDADDKDRLSIY